MNKIDRRKFLHKHGAKSGVSTPRSRHGCSPRCGVPDPARITYQNPLGLLTRGLSKADRRRVRAPILDRPPASREGQLTRITRELTGMVRSRERRSCEVCGRTLVVYCRKDSDERHREMPVGSAMANERLVVLDGKMAVHVYKGSGGWMYLCIGHRWSIVYATEQETIQAAREHIREHQESLY